MRNGIVAAMALVLAACSSAPTLPGLAACAPDDDCPPVESILVPGTQVPIYKTIQEPIYEERRTPVWGEKTVDVYQMRSKPVTITLPDGCGCERVVELWDVEHKVQVGVRRVPACIGYKVERVQVGSCPKRVRVGWRTVTEDECAPVVVDPCAPAR